MRIKNERITQSSKEQFIKKKKVSLFWICGSFPQAYVKKNCRQCVSLFRLEDEGFLARHSAGSGGLVTVGTNLLQQSHSHHRSKVCVVAASTCHGSPLMVLQLLAVHLDWSVCPFLHSEKSAVEQSGFGLDSSLSPKSFPK